MKTNVAFLNYWLREHCVINFLGQKVAIYLRLVRRGIYLERLENQYVSEACHQLFKHKDNCIINLLPQFGEETKHRIIDFNGKESQKDMTFTLLVNRPLERKKKSILGKGGVLKYHTYYNIHIPTSFFACLFSLGDGKEGENEESLGHTTVSLKMLQIL